MSRTIRFIVVLVLGLAIAAAAAAVIVRRTTTAWFDKEDRPYSDSAGYTAPPLRWFRGLDGHATLQPQRLTAHAEILMRRETANGLKLPGF